MVRPAAPTPTNIKFNIPPRAIRLPQYTINHRSSPTPLPTPHPPPPPRAPPRKARRKKQALDAERKRAQADKAKRGEPPGMEENTDELIQWLERMYVTCSSSPYLGYTPNVRRASRVLPGRVLLPGSTLWCPVVSGSMACPREHHGAVNALHAFSRF